MYPIRVEFKTSRMAPFHPPCEGFFIYFIHWGDRLRWVDLSAEMIMGTSGGIQKFDFKNWFPS